VVACNFLSLSLSFEAMGLLLFVSIFNKTIQFVKRSAPRIPRIATIAKIAKKLCRKKPSWLHRGGNDRKTKGKEEIAQGVLTVADLDKTIMARQGTLRI